MLLGHYVGERRLQSTYLRQLFSRALSLLPPVCPRGAGWNTRRVHTYCYLIPPSRRCSYIAPYSHDATTAPDGVHVRRAPALVRLSDCGIPSQLRVSHHDIVQPVGRCRTTASVRSSLYKFLQTAQVQDRVHERAVDRSGVAVWRKQVLVCVGKVLCSSPSWSLGTASEDMVSKQKNEVQKNSREHPHIHSNAQLQLRCHSGTPLHANQVNRSQLRPL